MSSRASFPDQHRALEERGPAQSLLAAGKARSTGLIAAETTALAEGVVVGVQV